MPDLEPATINRHEVNKVADAGAWDKSNLPLFAFAKAHPWKEICSLPLLPSLPAGWALGMESSAGDYLPCHFLQLPWSPALLFLSQDGGGGRQ